MCVLAAFEKVSTLLLLHILRADANDDDDDDDDDTREERGGG